MGRFCEPFTAPLQMTSQIKDCNCSSRDSHDYAALRPQSSTFTSADNSYSEQPGDPRSVVAKLTGLGSISDSACSPGKQQNNNNLSSRSPTMAADKCHIAIRVQASTTAAAAVNDFTQRIFLPSQGKGADYNLVLAVQRSTMA